MKPLRLHDNRPLEEAMRAEVLRVLPVALTSDRSALEAMQTNDMLAIFFNWQSRLIHPHQRRVYRSTALLTSHAYEENREFVNLICAKLAAGLEVNAHLSDRVMDGYRNRKPGSPAGRDLDLLLNDWGIHHLHLSPVPRADGFNERTKPLLFVMVTHGAAYILLVGDHESWTDVDLVKAAVRSWPEAGLFQKVKGTLAGTARTEAELLLLREAGIASMLVVDDEPYLPGLSLGLSAARTSSRDALRANEVFKWLRLIQKDAAPYLDQLRDAVVAAGGRWPAKPELQLVWIQGCERYGFALQENTSRSHLML